MHFRDIRQHSKFIFDMANLNQFGNGRMLSVRWKCLQAGAKRKLKLWTGLITVLRHSRAFISAKLKTRSTKSEVTATFTSRSNPALFDASGIKVSSQYSQASIILDDTIRNRGTRPLFPFAPANSRRELASQLIIAHRSYCFSLLPLSFGMRWDLFSIVPPRREPFLCLPILVWCRRVQYGLQSVGVRKGKPPKWIFMIIRSVKQPFMCFYCAKFIG